MKISIFGLARSGLSAMKLAIAKGYKVDLINKGEPATWTNFEEIKDLPVKYYSEEEYLKKNIDSDLVLSPGIPRNHQLCQRFEQAGFKIISEIEWAYQFGSPTVIAITGSNGKTTTTSMIFEALSLAGFKVFVGGNIGIPYSEIHLTSIQYDYAVIEVSSFQLESIHTFHPHIAVLTNIYPNHMERYTSFDDYKNAKLNILKNLNDKDYVYAHETFLPLKTLAQVHAANVNEIENYDFSKSLLVGKHNKENFAAALFVLSALNLPNKKLIMQKLIDSFKGVEHRIEFVCEKNNLRFYNDSKSTNSLALKTALAAFTSDIPVILILGGKLREGKVELNSVLKPFKNINKIFCIGEAASLIEADLKHDFDVETSFDLETTLKRMTNLNLKGSVIFSPAFPSFDQFKNFEDRGKCFKELVLKL